MHCETFSASTFALEHWGQIKRQQRQWIGMMPKPQVSATSTAADQPTDREADSRYLSPLRRKTSEMEGEPTKGSKKSQVFNLVLLRRLHCHKHFYALEHCSEKSICNIILHNLSRVKYKIALISRLETVFFTIYFGF
jgi:hypothetical protein